MKLSWFNQYWSYLKNNPNGFWFKRKLYGWGWTPATWQGWLATLIYLSAIIFWAILKGDSPDFIFWFIFLILTALFVLTAYKKGEKPKWQWGIKDKDE